MDYLTSFRRRLQQYLRQEMLVQMLVQPPI
jgi:hypothetical protein